MRDVSAETLSDSDGSEDLAYQNTYNAVWDAVSKYHYGEPAASHWIACVTIGTCALRVTVTCTMEWLQGRMCLQRSSENPTPGEGI